MSRSILLRAVLIGILALGGSLSHRAAAQSLSSDAAISDDASRVEATYLPIVTSAPAIVTARVSVGTGGIQANGSSLWPSLSTDGRFVAFSSSATNLVSDDTNGLIDIFVHDRASMSTERVSVATSGTQADGESIYNAISSDGRFVVFHSYASNLVSGDTNGQLDIFVRDRQSGTTERVSVATDGTQANAWSWDLALSNDGRYVAFSSLASNLVAGDTNNVPDIFVHDRASATTERISVASDGSEGNEVSWWPSISANGRYITYYSAASNLVPGDTNGTIDVFVRDRQTGLTTRVSVATDGTQGNGGSGSPAISDDGRYVAFDSQASNLVNGDTNLAPDIFVHDRQTGTTTRVSITAQGNEANSASYRPAISADGRHITFHSFADNLVPDDTNGLIDIFDHDRQTGQTVRVSVSTDGAEGNGESWTPVISDDGNAIAFESDATNLVGGDTNGVRDIFVRQ